MPMRTLIIDDEPKAIELLKGYLTSFEQVQLLQTFRNGISALEFLNSHEVDLIFLDINMPHLSGIQLAKALNGACNIIFTTAHAEFAAESYNIEALDYLVKPITFERFAASMRKVSRHNNEVNADSRPILLKSGNEYQRVKVREILFLEKDGNYMTYQTIGPKIIVRQSIAEALALLPDNFIQVHKSYIVNLTQVDSFRKEALTIKGHEIPVGQMYREKTKNHFEQ